MINRDMRLYDYYLYKEKNAYGQRTVGEEPQGKVKIAINISSQTVQDNVLYTGCQYVGITHNKSIDDTYVIKYGEEMLKVLYINPKGRYRVVYLAKVK